MYIVTISNNGVETQIHNVKQKLVNGSVAKGINSIDAFSFTIYPSNVGFDELRTYKTLVRVFNTARNRYEYYGRVLYSNPTMSESGVISKDVTCEDYFGFFCDSQQEYVEEKNWTLMELLGHIVNVHNSQVEDYKQFKIGEVTVTAPNDNIYIGIQRENTWNTLNDKLLDTLGGELRYRVEEDGLYLDYLTQIGEDKPTAIQLSHNMKSISKENDPTRIVTRLIPLGAKISGETEERLTIESVNDGLNYIEDEDAKELYGMHVGYREWDDVTIAANLLEKGREWLAQNNKALVKYTVTALDLSLIGKDIDDFEVGNSHPIKNALLHIDDTARIIKKTIDICEETKSTIEVGDIFKQLSDLQVEQDKKIKKSEETTKKLSRTTSSGLTNLQMTAGQHRELIQKVQQEVDDTGTTLKTALVDIDATKAKITLVAGVKEFNDIDNDFVSVKEAVIEIDGAKDTISANAEKIKLNASDIVSINKHFSGDATIVKAVVTTLDVVNSFKFKGNTCAWKSFDLPTSVDASLDYTDSFNVVINAETGATRAVKLAKGVNVSLNTKPVNYLGWA